MTEYRYKWVRVALRGVPDAANAERHVAAGWELVPPGELPVKVAASEPAPRWSTPAMLDPSVSNEENGLQLYRLTAEKAAERDAYYQEMNKRALDVAPKWGPANAGTYGGIFDFSTEMRNNDPIAQLEDHFNPMWIAEFEYDRKKRLTRANALLAQLGLPPWELQTLRRDLMKHIDERGGKYRVSPRTGPVWFIYGRSKESMRKLRLDWRMPRGLGERLEMYRDDIRTAISAQRYRGTGL